MSYGYVMRLKPVIFVAILVCLWPFTLQAQEGLAENAAVTERKISLSFRDMDIAQIMSMLSKKERVNILLAKGVEGKVSVNLYDVSLDDAIHSIANTAGYSVMRRDGNYYVVKTEDAAANKDSGLTAIKTLRVQYTDPTVVEGILRKHLSRYGSITVLKERGMLVVEDMPSYLTRIEGLLKQLDHQPRQILIVAKILEVTLDDSESYGLDWKKIFSAQDGSGNVGTRGLGSTSSPGFFFDFVNPNIEVFLDTLKARGRVRTLSTPKLLALENQEASVIIGDRIGYKVTTTINQVTTESIEFLESGVILKVTPAVDGEKRIMLDIHPEVSTGTIADGIPSQTTTEVTTQLLVPNGETIFIGGLMKHRLSETRDGVPILGDLPGVGRLFSNEEKISINTETIVLITPYLVEPDQGRLTQSSRDKVKQAETVLQGKTHQIDHEVEQLLADPVAEQTAPKARRKQPAMIVHEDLWAEDEENW